MASKSTIKALTTISLCSGVAEQIRDAYKAREQVNNAESVRLLAIEAMSLWPDKLDTKQIIKLKNDLLYLEAIVGKNCQAATLTSVILAMLDDLMKAVNKYKVDKLNLLFSAVLKMHNFSDRSLTRFNEYVTADKAVNALYRRLEA